MDIVAGNTALGRIEIELFFDITPQTCENFRGLCTGEYGDGHVYRKKLTYKGTKIFKVIEGKYMIGGDIVYNSGRGGESIYGEFFKDENFKRRHACGGLLSMNNFGKDKNNSQFIITIKACPQLDDKHVVFGHIIKGMEVINEISKIPTDMNNRPKVKIFVFNCGDYDFKRTKFQGDIFKETIDEIIRIRTEKEKIKLMGPEEIKEYNKELKEKKDKIEEIENENYENKDNNDEIKFDINGNNLINDLIADNNKNNKLKQGFDIDNEEDSEEDEELADKDDIKDNKKLIDDDIMKEYESTLLKINEAINLNTKEVNLSNYLTSNRSLSNQDNTYIYYNGKKTDKNWAKKEEETKNILLAKGIPESKKYLLESINQNEKRANYLKKKKKREINGNDLFTVEAYYRAYKKRSKELPFDKELYDDEMQNGISKNKIQNEVKKELLENDMKQQIEKRSKFSRRRKILEEDEINYINERNERYNKKLYRAFGKESKEVRNNLERRTAL
jgi:cyclophilin family peptidyl-prolyl cis-trans isomerase